MGDRHHPSALRMCSFGGLQPNHFTCGLCPSSVNAPVDVHDPSCNFPFIHPRETLLVGCWVTTLPSLSCGVLFPSPPKEVVLHGVGLVHLSHVWWLPIHKGMPTSDMQREEASFSGGLLTIHVGSSLHRRAHQLQFVMTPPKSLHPTWSLIFLFPFQASAFTSTEVARFQIHSAYFSVVVPFLLACLCSWLGLHLPQGTPQLVSHRSYIGIHFPGRGPLSWGPHCCQWWGRWSRLGA